MDISMEHMGTDALKKSYYIAKATNNFPLAERIEKILKIRGEKIPASPTGLSFKRTMGK
jgi:hypothetical protein